MIFSCDPPNILSCIGIGIGYKIKVKIKVLCTAYASNVCNKILYPS